MSENEFKLLNEVYEPYKDSYLLNIRKEKDFHEEVVNIHLYCMFKCMEKDYTNSMKKFIFLLNIIQGRYYSDLDYNQKKFESKEGGDNN